METSRFLSEIFLQDQTDLSWVPDGMSRRLLEYEASTQTRAMALVSTPSPLTRSRKSMLELEDTVEPVQCLALSPVHVNDKGKFKKLKHNRCFQPKPASSTYELRFCFPFGGFGPVTLRSRPKLFLQGFDPWRRSSMSFGVESFGLPLAKRSSVGRPSARSESRAPQQ
ncbi:uncharacterized protein C2845_PM07G09270 [Panicum miliaceum]|uniref:Uncharacterized protein n=1 Tax=Panicum miliaceum TaxID=4540 RepID=A0A3L6SJW0_PANMI|nr:uncharacterized protein C2845_PM07G09270 [Panicum miliaceum]